MSSLPTLLLLSLLSSSILTPPVTSLTLEQGVTPRLQGTFFDRLTEIIEETKETILPHLEVPIAKGTEALVDGVKFVEREVNAIGGQINANIDLIHDTDHGVRACNARDPMETGVCFSATKCGLLSGKPVGLCRIFTPKTTCCKFTRSCGGTSEQTVTYFSPEDHNGTCNMRLGARLGACQLRIDFITMIMAAPDAEGRCPPVGSLEILRNGRRVMTLCGTNSANHLYLPLALGDIIEFVATSTPDGSSPHDLMMKLTQVDCRSGVAAMRALRAPDGCLQYFTAADGAIASFNFDFESPIAPGQDYSICFRSTPDLCQLKLTSHTFDMPGQRDCGGGTYVAVAGARAVDDGRSLGRDRFCGRRFGRDGRLVAEQKPFIVRVKVAEGEETMGKPGFLSAYELVKCSETP